MPVNTPLIIKVNVAEFTLKNMSHHSILSVNVRVVCQAYYTSGMKRLCAIARSVETLRFLALRSAKRNTWLFSTPQASPHLLGLC